MPPHPMGGFHYSRPATFPMTREEATVTLPEWWFEIITIFGDLYEPCEAEYRTQKVFNELIGKRIAPGEVATRH